MTTATKGRPSPIQFQKTINSLPTTCLELPGTTNNFGLCYEFSLCVCVVGEENGRPQKVIVCVCVCMCDLQKDNMTGSCTYPCLFLPIAPVTDTS